ncbi:hypothetical protein J2W34_000736 [Variovorax boronicumulans]|uniref:SPRY domain-containing protein n=1 Tax=Variovorax boronicumulans TaxID=436515 RepID=UPI0027858F75|nr:SPRY domain-containing protein [Variovorax boronicumulans]MDQ0068962.1 hypothetical protein [Variovorax boronicumulans]
MSEFQLLAGTTRVDASATLTSSIAPSSGALAALKDGDTSTDAAWAAGSVSGLLLMWDFGPGGDVDVTDIRLGSVSNRANFLYSVGLRFSDDGTTWTEAYVFLAPAWPGERAKTTSVPRGVWNPYDVSGPAWSISGNVLTATTSTLNGARSRAAASSGVRQFEIVIVGNMGALVGAVARTASISPLPGSDAAGWMFIPAGGNKYSAGLSTPYYGGSSVVSGDVLGVVVDFGAGAITFYKNGVSLGVAFSGVSGDLRPAVGVNTPGARTHTLNTAGSFVFPIAGAVAWDATLEVRYVAPTRAVGGPSIPLVAVPPYYSGVVVTPPVAKIRGDYVTGVLGAGRGRVQGTTKDKGTPNVPVSERVRLYREQDGLLMRETWSTPGTGAYSFDEIDELQTYTVLSYDHDKAFRAVVADGLTLANGGVELIA